MEKSTGMDEPLSPGRILAHYELVREIGRGGMGRVYMAQDLDLNRRAVALKILPQELADDRSRRHRFNREANVASALNHPNVATVYGIGESDGIHFIAMEFVDGTTLSEEIKKGRIPQERAVPLAIQLVDALKEAHSSSIIHRDIKPGNVMVNQRGHVKVLDFGIAGYIRADDDPTNTGLTGSALIGTAPYMSPEQILFHTVDHRTDLFSVGVVLYEMVTGRLPFKGESTIETLNLIAKSTPVPPSQIVPGIDPGLERIIDRCLKKDPAERYASASELLTDLQAIAGTTSPSQRMSGKSAVQKLIPVSSWNRAAILIPLVVILGAATVGIWRISRLTAQPGQENVVILPFEAIGNSDVDRAYSNGLTETLTTKLIQVTQSSPVQVVASSEVRRRGVKTIQDARTEVGGTLVVTGALQQQAGAVRINYTLTNAATQKVVKAESITLDNADAFSVQDKLTESVAHSLGLNVQPNSPAQSPAYGALKPGASEYYLQGRGYLQNSDKPADIENAITVFQRAIDLDRDFSPAYAGLGQAYWQKFTLTKDLQWAETARSSCERALALSEKAPEPHSCLGVVDNGMGRYEKAVEEFQEVLKQDSSNQDAYIGLANAYDKLGRGPEAEQTYRKAIETRPYYWGGYFSMGTYYYRKGKYQDAERMFDQVVALAPDNVPGYNNLGSMYFFQGKADQAIQAFEKSQSLRPTYAALNNLGTIYFYQKHDYPRAVAAFRRALAITGSDARVWGDLGFVLERTGEKDEAKKAFSRAKEIAEANLKLNPRDASTMGSLADYTAALGNNDEARQLLSKALAQAPDDPGLLFEASSVYESLGDRDAALAALDRAVMHGQSWIEIQRSPVLEKLRTDPRFKAIEAKATTK